jgi:hypothetical protein
MRTTLDLDERALTAARAKAAKDGTSIGRAVSDLILRQVSTVELAEDFPVFSRVPDHTITPELVDDFRDDD